MSISFLSHTHTNSNRQWKNEGQNPQNASHLQKATIRTKIKDEESICINSDYMQ